MPLASVEEWRARIGSSWCALARPFKTSKSSGNYRSFAALSGSTMLQAVCALMAMVLALTRDTTIVFIRGAKSVNGCVNDCWRQIKNNVHPRGILMILILLVQATTFIQSSLLLRCGDIESNPGPGIYPDLDYDDVDSSTILFEDDLREVRREVVRIQSNYYQFGIELGLPPQEMDTVQETYRQNIPQIFTEVLKIFLNQRYNVQKYGPPTWRKLVEAVDSHAGGNNHTLAKKIAKCHPVDKGGGNVRAQHHLPAPQETPVDETTIETSVDHSKGSRALVQRCRETMAAYYQRQVDDRAWPPVKSTNFVNLALIGDQTSWRKTVQESVDEIIGDKTPTSYQSMVDDNCIGTMTLLEGRPGSGKTVLMNKISCDWAKGEILKSSLLIFIPLRRLREQPDRKLATLLRVACSALPQNDIDELASYIEKTQGEGIVFAFDGFDEYVPYHYEKKLKRIVTVPVSNKSTPSRTHTDKVPSSNPLRKERKWYDNVFRRKRKSEREPTMVQMKHKPLAQVQEKFEYIQLQVEDVFKLLKAKTLINSTIFITSRPAACNDFREHAKKQIEVLGFLKPQIIEYVNYHFSTDKCKAQQLVAHLEHHPHLMHMAYLPLHCAMLAFLFEDDTFLPETETEFYKHFTLSTLLRSLRRQQGTITTTITSFDQLPQREKTIFDKVCKLAFNATVNSKQVFTSADIESVLPGTDSGDASKDVSDLGLIVTDRYFMRYGLNDTYTFLHLTFQEYLGAVYVAELSESERMEIIQTYKNKENLSIVWRFLCGMMDFSQFNTMVTFENIMKAIKNKLEQAQCCFETRHSSPCSYVINSSNGQLDFSSINFTPSDYAAISYTISRSDFQSDSMICLIFDKCSFSTEGALSILQIIGDHPLSLTLSNCQSTRRSDIIKDCFSKYHIPDLQILNLRGNGIGDKGALALAEHLKCYINMKELNLSNNSIGHIGALALADLLKHCVNVKELNLSENSIDVAGMQSLIEGIQCCPMEILNFGHNCVGNAGALVLADYLKHCASITKLNVSHNGIEDAGIWALAESIKHLKELNLDYNCLSDDAIPVLINVIQTYENLEKLSLEGNDFTAMEANELAVAQRNRGTVLQVNIKNQCSQHFDPLY